MSRDDAPRTERPAEPRPDRARPGGRGPGGPTSGTPGGGGLTDVDGIEVGHWTGPGGRTGCTVVLAPPEGAVASCEIGGAAPGTRETALLEPSRTVERVHAVLLTGGSAFGLAAADGVAAWLEERGRGFPTPAGPVPIVPAAVLYDLAPGAPRPGPEAGRLACEAAGPGSVPAGRVGAGAGARVGKLFGPERSAPGGLGGAAVRVPAPGGSALVAALAVANAVGNVVDPATGALLAGAAPRPGETPAAAFGGPAGTNTTLLVLATDAPLDKAGCRALARAAHLGLARAVRPLTVFDGDAAFALSTGRGAEVPLAALHVAAQEAAAAAVVDAVRDRPDPFA